MKLNVKLNVKALVFLLLSISYAAYSLAVYTTGKKYEPVETEKEDIIAGKLLWQKHNCQSCHQIYGLGGYLGPDLTNCFSSHHKGPAYMDAIMQYGTGVMPNFNLSETERSQLISFLKQVDKSGRADPKSFTISYTGNISPHASQ